MPTISLGNAARALFLLGLLLLGAIAEASPGPQVNTVFEQGRQLYASNCLGCHGPNGDRLPAAPLQSRAFLDSRGDATLVTLISQGKGTMPAAAKSRGGGLTEAQIRAVVAYLSASVGRVNPALLDFGQTIYDKNCAQCHGEKGDRIPVAPLSARAFMASRSDADLASAISEGKGVMAGFRTANRNLLSEQQVRSVVAYLRYRGETGLIDQAGQGRQLYESYCLACHGEGGDRLPNVALHAPDYLSKRGDSALAQAIMDGKGNMPAFGLHKGGAFQISDVGAILTYLKSSAGFPAGAALAPLPVPNNGRDLYVRSCAGCHGDGGDKLLPVRLKAREYLGTRSDAALLQAIRLGNDKGMAAWGEALGGPLTDDAIKQIIEYLRFLSGGQFLEPAAAPAPAPTPAPTPANVAPQAPAPAATAALPAGDPARGRELFTQSCVACHGETRDKMPTAKLNDAAWLQQRGDAALAQSIAGGKGSMPAWGKEKGGQLSEADIAAVLAYLKSAAGSAQSSKDSGLPPGPKPSAGDPTLPLVAISPTVGRALFETNCVPCHGPDGLAVTRVPLGSATWIANRDRAKLRRMISNGKPGLGMPVWSKRSGGPLSDSQIGAIIAYLPELGAANAKAGVK